MNWFSIFFLLNRFSFSRCSSCGSSLSTMNNIVKSATKKINTKYELKDVSTFAREIILVQFAFFWFLRSPSMFFFSFTQLLEFAREHSKELDKTRTIKQSVEQAESNVRWLDRNYPSIRDWLEKNT